MSKEKCKNDIRKVMREQTTKIRKRNQAASTEKEINVTKTIETIYSKEKVRNVSSKDTNTLQNFNVDTFISLKSAKHGEPELRPSINKPQNYDVRIKSDDATIQNSDEGTDKTRSNASSDPKYIRQLLHDMTYEKESLVVKSSGDTSLQTRNSSGVPTGISSQIKSHIKGAYDNSGIEDTIETLNNAMERLITQLASGDECACPAEQEITSIDEMKQIVEELNAPDMNEQCCANVIEACNAQKPAPTTTEIFKNPDESFSDQSDLITDHVIRESMDKKSIEYEKGRSLSRRTRRLHINIESRQQNCTETNDCEIAPKENQKPTVESNETPDLHNSITVSNFADGVGLPDSTATAKMRYRSKKSASASNTIGDQNKMGDKSDMQGDNQQDEMKTKDEVPWVEVCLPPQKSATYAVLCVLNDPDNVNDMEEIDNNKSDSPRSDSVTNEQQDDIISPPFQKSKNPSFNIARGSLKKEAKYSTNPPKNKYVSIDTNTEMQEFSLASKDSSQQLYTVVDPRLTKKAQGSGYIPEIPIRSSANSGELSLNNIVPDMPKWTLKVDEDMTGKDDATKKIQNCGCEVFQTSSKTSDISGNLPPPHRSKKLCDITDPMAVKCQESRHMNPSVSGLSFLFEHGQSLQSHTSRKESVVPIKVSNFEHENVSGVFEVEGGVYDRKNSSNIPRSISGNIYMEKESGEVSPELDKTHDSESEVQTAVVEPLKLIGDEEATPTVSNQAESQSEQKPKGKNCLARLGLSSCCNKAEKGTSQDFEKKRPSTPDNIEHSFEEIFDVDMGPAKKLEETLKKCYCSTAQHPRVDAVDRARRRFEEEMAPLQKTLSAIQRKVRSMHLTQMANNCICPGPPMIPNLIFPKTSPPSNVTQRSRIAPVLDICREYKEERRRSLIFKRRPSKMSRNSCCNVSRKSRTAMPMCSERGSWKDRDREEKQFGHLHQSCDQRSSASHTAGHNSEKLPKGSYFSLCSQCSQLATGRIEKPSVETLYNHHIRDRDIDRNQAHSTVSRKKASTVMFRPQHTPCESQMSIGCSPTTPPSCMFCPSLRNPAKSRISQHTPRDTFKPKDLSTLARENAFYSGSVSHYLEKKNDTKQSLKGNSSRSSSYPDSGFEDGSKRSCMGSSDSNKASFLAAYISPPIEEYPARPGQAYISDPDDWCFPNRPNISTVAEGDISSDSDTISEANHTTSNFTIKSSRLTQKNRIMSSRRKPAKCY